MRTFILTWNPRNWQWPIEDRLDVLEQLYDGESVPGRWSIYVNFASVSPGDRVFLRKSGQKPRGFIAAADVVSSAYEDRHFNEDEGGLGATSRYVDLEWTSMVDVDEVMGEVNLKLEFPDTNWTPQANGHLLTGDEAAALESSWIEHLRELGDRDLRAGNGGDGGGWEVLRRYRNRIAKYRLHQRKFRESLLRERGAACECCGLDAIEVLDAAHIQRDVEGGRSNSANGVILCANHHRAFDNGLLLLRDEQFLWIEGVEPF